MLSKKSGIGASSRGAEVFDVEGWIESAPNGAVAFHGGDAR